MLIQIKTKEFPDINQSIMYCTANISLTITKPHHTGFLFLAHAQILQLLQRQLVCRTPPWLLEIVIESEIVIGDEMLVEEEDAEGVLKMNSKILDTSELKKLDKLEKYAVQELHNTEKGRTGRVIR